MAETTPDPRFPKVADGIELAHDDRFYREEIQNALRNREMPLEALRYPVTPTGMHYLLVHFDIPDVNVQDWRLEIGGLVSNPISLSLDDIKNRPSTTIAVTMQCAGNGRALMSPRNVSQPWLVGAIGTAEWTGTPLKDLLVESGLCKDAVELVFTGLDQGLQDDDEIQSYQRSLSIAEATRDEVLLAYKMNGEPLQPQHGYPLRLLVPCWYGMSSVKWLTSIEALGEPFQGYQMVESYRYQQSKDEAGEPVALQNVRGLMIPPGIPDASTRQRLVYAGDVTLRGMAWAGRLGVRRVEVSFDGGSSWEEADLGAQASPYSWRPWSLSWKAAPGRYTLCVRAHDSRGGVQPLEQPWNYQGMGNNLVQRIEVIVE